MERPAERKRRRKSKSRKDARTSISGGKKDRGVASMFISIPFAMRHFKMRAINRWWFLFPFARLVCVNIKSKRMCRRPSAFIPFRNLLSCCFLFIPLHRRPTRDLMKIPKCVNCCRGVVSTIVRTKTTTTDRTEPSAINSLHSNSCLCAAYVSRRHFVCTHWHQSHRTIAARHSSITILWLIWDNLFSMRFPFSAHWRNLKFLLGFFSSLLFFGIFTD